MKPLLRLLLVAALSLLTLTGPALRAAPEPPAPPPAAPKVKLTFVNWEKFTDIVVDGTTTKIGSDVIFGELNRHLASLAKHHLAPGQTLVITMRDIDLAGAVEPWRGPDFGRIRYMRDTQPPRLVFDYQLLDATGAVVKEGSEKLTNLTYRYQISSLQRDTTTYEKQLLDDWMGDTFGTPKKPKKSKKP
jgi:hypothetical protein